MVQCSYCRHSQYTVITLGYTSKCMAQIRINPVWFDPFRPHQYVLNPSQGYLPFGHHGNRMSGQLEMNFFWHFLLPLLTK